MHGCSRRLRGTKFPTDAFCLSTKKGFNFFNHTFNIEQGVPGEYVRQSIGKVAGQAFPRSLMKLQFKGQCFLPGIIINERQADVIGPFIRITIKGFKEII